MVLQTCPCLQAFGGITETAKPSSLMLEVCVVALEAGVAGHTHRVLVAVASLALVAAGSRQTRAAEATACGFVTARTLGSSEVTVTG